jgi:hypothetical protein
MNFDDTARFFGPSEKLWPEPFAPPSTRATMLCRRCRNVAVSGIRRFCGKCAHARKLEATRESKRAKRGLNGRKTENSLIRTEALMHAENKAHGIDTPQPKKAGFSSALKGGSL